MGFELSDPPSSASHVCTTTRQPLLEAQCWKILSTSNVTQLAAFCLLLQLWNSHFLVFMYFTSDTMYPEFSFGVLAHLPSMSCREPRCKDDLMHIIPVQSHLFEVAASSSLSPVSSFPNNVKEFSFYSEYISHLWMTYLQFTSLAIAGTRNEATCVMLFFVTF